MQDAKNTYSLINGNGYTNDIVNAVMAVYADCFTQCNELAHELKGSTPLESCKNIFDYVHERIKYKEDPNGHQWVKEPARFIHDQQGDCKSYSIFINSCLRCLDIACVFRFVAYSAGDYTHVYPIALIDGKEIILDVVALELRNIPFNNELKYKTKKDMDGTRIARLAGIDTPTEVFTGNNDKLKINQLELYSEIDLLAERANITASPLDVETLYNQMDTYQIILQLIEKYSNAQQLELAGYVIAKAINEGAFSETFASMDDRAEYMNTLYSQIVAEIDTLSNPLNANQYQIQTSFVNSVADFLTWYKTHVLALNHYVEGVSVAGIGTTTADWANMVKNGAPVFLYATQTGTLSARTAEAKRQRQINMLNWLLTHNTGLTKTTTDNLIRAGVIAKFNAEPEKVISAMQGNKAVAGVGTLYDDILKGVNDLSGSVKTVADTVTAVKSVFGDSAATPATSNLYQTAPATSDWTSNLMVPSLGAGAIVVGAIMLKKKKNAKKR